MVRRKHHPADHFFAIFSFHSRPDVRGKVRDIVSETELAIVRTQSKHESARDPESIESTEFLHKAGSERKGQMNQMNVRDLQKHQARLLREKGLGYGGIAKLTGLGKETVRYVCRDIQPGEENRHLDRQMKNGEACLFCGEDLKPQHGSGRRRKFCCEECRRAYWKINRKKLGVKRPESMHVYSCAYCGKTFESYGKVSRKYCSRTCYLLHRYGDQMEKVVQLPVPESEVSA